MKLNKFIFNIFITILIISILFGKFPSSVFATSQSVKKVSYITNKSEESWRQIKQLIENLQVKYPKWIFKVQEINLDWDDVVKEETKRHKTNLVQYAKKSSVYQSYNKDWLCSCGYHAGSWYCASDKAVAYMMDPRNSINTSDIFQFLQLSYDEDISDKTYKSNIKSILSNTFLDDGNLDSYIETIVSECKKKNVNPCYIAGKIIQEQGTDGGATYKIAASDTTSNNISLDANSKIITVVPETTVKDIKNFLGTNYTVKNKDGKQVKNSDNVATGYTANSNYTIVMLGDVNCDGKVRATDYMKIKNYIMETASLDKYQKLAADVNLDGKVRATDYMRIKNYIMETSDIQLKAYYYNIFNINATVTSTIENALSYAKKHGLDTIEKCLIDGIDFIAEKYVSTGQDTLYYEKFDVIGDSLYSHQYAQDVLYAQNQGTRLRKLLGNMTDASFTFIIPLYTNMPNTICSRPAVQTK